MSELRAALLLTASLALLLPVAGSAGEYETLREELRQVEIDVEEMRRFLPEPSETNLQEWEGHIRRRAASAGLPDIEVTRVAGAERLTLDDGTPAAVEIYRLDVRARADYMKVHQFFDQLSHARESRIFDYETLHLKAEEDGSVTASARIALACYAAEVVETPRSDASGSATERMTAAIRTALNRKRAGHRLLIALDARSQPGRLVSALASLDREGHDQALALTEVRAGGGMLGIDGVVLGAAARGRLEATLKNAGIEAADIRRTTTGDCEAFSATGRVVSAVATDHVRGLFDGATGAACSAPATSFRSRITVNKAPVGAKAFTLHLRGADVADVFRLLNGLSSEDFIVDSDVTGSVDVDAERATLEEMLLSINAAGVTIGPGPVHRVHRSSIKPPPARSDKYEGSPLSFSLKDADLSDFLCLFTDITGLKFFQAPSYHGRVSLFVDEVEWDRVLDAVLAAHRLSYSIDKDQVFLAPRAAATVNVCDASPYRRQWWRLKAEQLGVADLRLAVIERTGDAWTAYAYAPGASRIVLALDPSQPLFDGRVEKIMATGVTFRVGERLVTVSLPPLK